MFIKIKIQEKSKEKQFKWWKMAKLEQETKKFIKEIKPICTLEI